MWSVGVSFCSTHPAFLGTYAPHAFALERSTSYDSGVVVNEYGRAPR
jgi:hypothetical protein